MDATWQTSTPKRLSENAEFLSAKKVQWHTHTDFFYLLVSFYVVEQFSLTLAIGMQGIAWRRRLRSSNTSRVAYRLVTQFLHGRLSRVTHYVSVVMTTGLWLTSCVTFYWRHLLLLVVILPPTNHHPARPSDMNNSWFTPDWLGWLTVVRLVSCSGAAVLVASHAWLFVRQVIQACWTFEFYHTRLRFARSQQFSRSVVNRRGSRPVRFTTTSME